LPDQPPIADPDRTLKPPQFTLRTLLVFTAVVAVLLAVMNTIGAMWSLALVFLLVLAAAHVVGNSLGTKLREGAPRREVAPAAPSAGRTPLPSAAVRSAVVAPTRLREPARLHWSNIVLTAAGMAAGAYFGGSALVGSYPDAPVAAFVLAYVSSGVLGGFAGFVVFSFLAVVRQALSEAHAGSDAHPPRSSATPKSTDGQ